MYIDMFGQTRYKINLHTHTTRSDGEQSPEEAARRYREQGYDAIAISDHWVIGMGETVAGLPILPGVEFDVGYNPITEGVFHILSICHEAPPAVTQGMTPAQMIDAIHRAGGFAILAHPEWSLNTVAQISAEAGAMQADATEIYNTVSDFGMSYRADSSAIVDRMAMIGKRFPLTAADDTHYYTGDECRSYIMLKADSLSRTDVLKALRAGDFYATQGPEVHARIEGNTVIVDCSPCARVNFHTQAVWREGAVVRGYHLTHAEFDLSLDPRPAFLRVSVEDEAGKRAWTGFLPLGENA